MRVLLPAGLALLIAGALLLWVAGRLRRRSGMPRGKVIYSDTRAWQECPEPLYAPQANLAGKPDYLVKKWRYVLPVEVKSSPAPSEPYRGHILQLAAYCLLIEEAMGVRPPYGLIHYADRTFAIRYTGQLENELLDTLEWMRKDLRGGAAERNHNDPARCHSCSYVAHCDQRLDC